MFHLEEATKHTLVHYHPRTEKHGKEDFLAADLKMMAALPASILDLFQPGMRAKFYVADEDGALNKLSYAYFAPIVQTLEYTGRAVTLDYGLGDDERPEPQLDFQDGRTSNIKLTGCKIAKIKFTCQDGGTVILEYRVQISKIEPITSGLLHSLQKRSVWVIIPPIEVQPDPNEYDPDAAGDPPLDDEQEPQQDAPAPLDGQLSHEQPQDNSAEDEGFIAAHTVHGAAAEGADDPGVRRGRRRPS